VVLFRDHRNDRVGFQSFLAINRQMYSVELGKGGRTSGWIDRVQRAETNCSAALLVIAHE
jgi:hypothetical protein